MTKKALMGLALAMMVAGSVSAADFGKISSALGPSSYVTDIYGGFAGDNVGANFEWGIRELPLTLGFGFSPLVFLGEYALRVGYHPDIGVKGLDVYANATIGIMSVIFIPTFLPQIGMHLGGRYFFSDTFGAFLEGGWALNGNYVKLGVAIKKRA